MKDLSRRLDIALIIITHNLGVVARYADRVNVMYAARIIEQGTADDVFLRPCHPYTHRPDALGAAARHAARRSGSRPSRACRRTCARRPPAAGSRRAAPIASRSATEDPALREICSRPPLGLLARRRDRGRHAACSTPPRERSRHRRPRTRGATLRQSRCSRSTACTSISRSRRGRLPVVAGRRP